ncbi:Histone-lysine N-methyltransferase setd3 [Phytophthora cinnamomi]|uniref:Histone-lysine N-methyltransferase setd3 n=1 Tax=Phytophthora cinnamomi TaxID=4785 RepID=UPI0035597647|nr:Histone-lysine N-methyltransferase setd3 [Phytophthora cinnamomi]
MRKRSSAAAAAAVASIDQKDATQLKGSARIGRKKEKRPLRSVSRANAVFWGLVTLLAGVLLLRSPMFKGFPLTEEEKVAKFVDWFLAAGGNVSNKIAIQTFPGMGRGVVALQDVEESDELLFVPTSVIICYDTIAQEWNSRPKLKKNLERLRQDQEELLTAFLMWEQANDVASPLLFSSDEEVEALQDERMIKAARAERQRAKKAYGRFKRLFRYPMGDKDMDLSRYLWVRFLVNSRAFSIEGQRVLVPFGDIFNGKPDDETREHDNGQRFLQFHDLQPTGMTIRADRGTPSGEQLFEDYGDNSNYVYFLHHGFLMGDGGFDCAAFRLPPLAEAHGQNEKDTEQAETLADKTRVLSRIRVDDAPLACISRSGKLEDSGLVRIYTALYNMDAAQAAACNDAEAFSECFSPELMSNMDAEPGSQEITLMLNAIRSQLERYPTTIEDDRRALDQNDDIAKSSDNKYAVAFRLSRKEILHEVRVVLEQQLQLFEIETEADDNKLSMGLELNEVNEGSSKLERFQRWIARQHFPVNYLELRFVSEAVGYGTFATKLLSTGDAYLKVPVHAVMNVHSALKSPWIRQTMHELQKKRAGVARDETLLLLHLLEEKFGPSRLKSRWKPYLDMLPDLDNPDNTLGSPLFYKKDGEQLKALEGSGLMALVTNYRSRVSQVYAVLFGSLKRLAHDKTLIWLTERRFRWANAMLDSRSIWWNSQRHLVPLLDMVNCQELHSEHKPHHTNLDSTGRHAVTKASWDFKAGQEVVENYAQPNYIYLLYHGFVLGANSHDCAHFHLEIPPPARHREFAPLLRTLEIYSWSTDVCVSSTDDQKKLIKFTNTALLVTDPKEALQHLRNSATWTQTASKQAISSALVLVDGRLAQLQASSTATETSDFRTQSIHRFRQQQLQQMVTLRSTLHAKLLTTNVVQLQND